MQDLGYRYSISNCFNNPEHFKVILKKLYGNMYNVIIDSIIEKLGDFLDQPSIKIFITDLKNGV